MTRMWTCEPAAAASKVGVSWPTKALLPRVGLLIAAAFGVCESLFATLVCSEVTHAAAAVIKAQAEMRLQARRVAIAALAGPSATGGRVA